MLIEILGTRIIAPVFGASLFVWAALLAVTLSALAVGYYVGGVLVDRSPTARLLATVVASSGVLIAAVPLARYAVLDVVADLGPRMGPLLGAVGLFAPSLLVLGMTGPIAVRLATTDLRATGHRVGSIYATSTAGSLVGTLVTAFVLIPTFETQTILIGSAGLVALLSVVLFVGRRPHWVASVAVIAPLAAWAAPKPEVPTGFDIVESAESPYGRVQVIDVAARGVRLLRADHSVIGAELIETHTAAFGFLHLLENVRFVRRAAKDMLLIGLGSGSIAKMLAREGIRSDVVEIDPVVVRAAREHFGFTTEGEVRIEDARTFLRHADRRYDIIVHDTFTGGATPEHLLSVEVLQQIHRLLRPGGVLALNFVGYQRGPHVEATWLITRTIRAVFQNVRIFRDRAPDSNPDWAVNLTFFASDSEVSFDIPSDATFEGEACERIARTFQDWEILKDVPTGALITDQHNSIARLQLAAAEDHFEAMGRLLPRGVWLH